MIVLWTSCLSGSCVTRCKKSGQSKKRQSIGRIDWTSSLCRFGNGVVWDWLCLNSQHVRCLSRLLQVHHQNRVCHLKSHIFAHRSQIPEKEFVSKFVHFYEINLFFDHFEKRIQRIIFWLVYHLKMDWFYWKCRIDRTKELTSVSVKGILSAW